MSAEDDFTTPRLKKRGLKPVDHSPGITLEGLTDDQLIALRSEIDAKLPSMEIKDIDLGQEIILGYYTAKAILAEAGKDSDVPANQKAQLLNTCRNTLTVMVKIQERLYNAEQYKKIEAALTKVLKTLPVGAQDTFFELYGQELGVADQKITAELLEELEPE